jgi:hypothetical protein
LAAPFAAELGISSIIASQYYELRLAGAEPQVDYLVAFHRARAAELHEVVSSTIAREGAYQTDAWRAVQNLIAMWAHGTSLLASRTPFLWFELDDFARQPVGACPSVSVCLTPGYRIDQPNEQGTTEDLNHAREALAVLQAPASTEASLRRAFEELPVGGRWIHLSYMLGRPRRAVKLYGVVMRDQLLPFLERVGWAGDRKQVTSALARLYPAEVLGDELYLDLNLDDAHDARRCTLGLAVAQQHLSRGRADDRARSRILSGWLAAGLCDAERVSSVQRWPYSADPRRQHVFRRDVRYLDVKLVLRPDRGWQAKAYLGREIKVGFL